MPGPSYIFIENNILDDIKLFIKYNIIPFNLKVKIVKKFISKYRETNLYTRITWHEYNSSIKHIIKNNMYR